MEIYLISLEQDTQRRAELAQRFPQSYPKMQWIKAVNGKELSAKEYFSYAQKYFNNHKNLITPSEVGCTLSHIKALEEFLKKGEDYCLILEDDVTGCDEDIRKLNSMIENSFINEFMLCGGQDGLYFEKYIIGKELESNIFYIPKFSMKFLFRTCCYIVNRKLAKFILDKHKHGFEVADAWYNLFKDYNVDFLYSALLQHPKDLKNSHIEMERKVFYLKEKNFFKRIYKQGVFWKVYNRIRNDIYRWSLLLKGYKQIHKENYK
ncbi:MULTISPECIES: glycosyltransferase family 25 protein [Acinetobacter]|uniref:glycosyltransferase family 25 protein n=1 Tax=Acinetobacter TaxID=469 RepID=UPI0002CDCE54|nr:MULTISPECIES: glycosyltransferase family 25 protein [Acinetobacter]ENX56510.1 hypothetical protein F885_03893 [Acinetobacter higginsii]